MRHAHRPTSLPRHIALRAALVASLIAASSVAAGPPRVPDAEAYRHVGKTVTVCGRVKDTTWMEHVRGRPTFLNLGDSYPNHTFTVVIWDDTFAKFDAPPHRLFADSDICVTGRVETYKGKPQIIVRSPSQIVATSGPVFPAERFGYEERVVLKSLLTELGFPADPSNGDWDDEARDALRAFQASVGADGTGEREPRTLRRMAEAVDDLSGEQKTRILRIFLLNLAQREAP
jgi:micrococcal nuclease